MTRLQARDSVGTPPRELKCEGHAGVRPSGGGWPTDQTFQTRAAVLGVAGPHPQGEPMRGSTGSVSNPVFIIGIPVMVIIADLVTRGVHNF